MVGIGFAFTENILYLAAAYDGTDGLGPGGTEALTGTFILRGLVSPFAHPLFTAFIGIGVGLAVTSRRPLPRVLLRRWLGYVVAVLAHGLWNSVDALRHRELLRRLRHADAPGLPRLRRLRAVPPPLRARNDAGRPRGRRPARACIPATDIPWLVDLRARRHARAFARRGGGVHGERAMRDYQAAAIELAYLHHRYLRGTAPRDFAERGHEHVEQLNAVRPYIAFPGQVVPTR